MREWRTFPGKHFCLDFLRKVKNSLAHCRNSNYNIDQESWPGPPRSSDVCKREMPSFQHASIELIWTVKEESAYFNANRLLALREEIHDRQKNRDDVNDFKLKELVVDLNSTDRRLIICAKNTGAWLNIKVTMVMVTLLVAMEFCVF